MDFKKEVTMIDTRKQNNTVYHYSFYMRDSADGVSPKTGLSPVVTLSKNGGTFAPASGAVTEISGGWYKLAANSTDFNTLGELVINITAVGADSFVGKLIVVPFDPFDSVSLGLSFMTSSLSESYATDGSPASITQLAYMIWQWLSTKDATGTTLTVRKLDKSTQAMTFEVNSATAPTSISRTS